MTDKKYTVADISRLTGYNRSTVTRWMDKQKIKSASMQGNAPLYSAQVLSAFKRSHAPKDKATSERDLLVREKDARIKSLEDEVALLKKQLEIKDEQIRVATQLADQAQKLNLADKPRLTHADMSTESSSSRPEVDNHTQTATGSSSQTWLDRLFGRKK